jgi:hypothetical protein
MSAKSSTEAHPIVLKSPLTALDQRRGQAVIPDW